jgi:hypothetical protein
MSALPPKADIGTQPRDVRFVPLADNDRQGSSWGARTNQAGRPAERIASMSGAARIGTQPIPSH